MTFRLKTCRSFFLFLASLLFSSFCWGQLYQSSVSKATGSTGRASIEPIDAIVLNASTLPHLGGRHFSTSLQKESFAVGLSDNTEESYVPGGFYYFQKKEEYLRQDMTTRDVRVSFGEFAMNKLTLGLSGHYFENTYNEKKFSQTNGDISATWTPSDRMGFAVVATDLAPGSVEVPEQLRLSSKFGVGFNYIYEQFFRTRLDVISAPNMTFQKMTTALGFESYAAEWLVMRMGVAHGDFQRETWGSIGIGFLGPRFYCNYSFERTIARADTTEERNIHSIDLGIPF